jgi:molecular chaperone DnaJ
LKKKKNLYQVLKIKRDASPNEIKQAYRSAAKRFHPDISKKKEEKFRQVQEAYETLSDPEKKSVYDRELQPERKRDQSFYARQPFVRDDFFGSPFDWVDSSAGFRDFWSDFFSDFFPGHEESRKRHFVEILLTPEEARNGGEIPWDVPYSAPCSRCHGRGRVGGLVCGRCRGQGYEMLQKRAALVFPSGARDGSKMKISLGEVEVIATIRVGRG